MSAQHWLVKFALIMGLASASAADDPPQDLYFGEALFYAHQGQFFDALQRLDTEMSQYRALDEPNLDRFHYHIHDAEFSVGDFELRYRMHHRAGRAIRAVLEGAVEESVRNEAAYRLARIHFQKNQFNDALQALARIEGEIPDTLRDDIEFLRANVHLAQGQPSEAIAVLQAIQADRDLLGFIDYNLGIALLQSGAFSEAVDQLDQAGRFGANDRADFAIRDKSNLVLGAILFEKQDWTRAVDTLNRVRLEGPFSNQALLRAGWAEASANRYDRALVPWSLLSEREPTDVAVQEAMLALPHAYAEQNLHGRAALLYGRALETFSDQIKTIDASIQSIRDGRFLEALIREETRQDKDWVVRLRTVSDAPETYYLTELLASHEFHTALQNYLDLEDLRSRLKRRDTGLNAFEDLLIHRAQNYDPLLPDVDADFRELDTRIQLRLEQKEHLAKRLDNMLIAPRPEYLATTQEQIADQRLEAIEAMLADSSTPHDKMLSQRAARLRGVIKYRLETEYHERLTTAYEHLLELNNHIDVMKKNYDSFVRARQAATHSYVGYEITISRLRERVRSAIARIDTLMARQGHLIETVAIERLQARRARLVTQQTQARYAVADSYDRAVQTQSSLREP